MIVMVAVAVAVAVAVRKDLYHLAGKQKNMATNRIYTLSTTIKFINVKIRSLPVE